MLVVSYLTFTEGCVQTEVYCPPRHHTLSCHEWALALMCHPYWLIPVMHWAVQSVWEWRTPAQPQLGHQIFPYNLDSNRIIFIWACSHSHSCGPAHHTGSIGLGYSLSTLFFFEIRIFILKMNLRPPNPFGEPTLLVRLYTFHHHLNSTFLNKKEFHSFSNWPTTKPTDRQVVLMKPTGRICHQKKQKRKKKHATSLHQSHLNFE